VTAAITFGLLVLGSFVTSFRVGMADPVWPTEPWRLAMIDWSEPDPGFIVEHAHRLIGWTTGGFMALLALGLIFTECRRDLRWGGLTSVVLLLGAFGWLHGVLIAQTRRMPPGTPLTVPPGVAAALALAALAVFVYCGLTIAAQSKGWGLRIVGVVLLICVMVQGLLGGLRVHLNALLGDGLAAIHGSFSQVVFGLVVLAAAMLSFRPSSNDLMYRYPEDGAVARPVRGLRVWAFLALIAVYAQVFAGAALRHLTSPMAGRLHLLFAFVAAIALAVTAVRLAKAGGSKAVIGLTHGLLTLQIVLGVESWLARFGNGFFDASVRRITGADAILRSSHAVCGYLLVAVAVIMAARACRTFVREPIAEAVA
jgi:heme A synthase